MTDYREPTPLSPEMRLVAQAISRTRYCEATCTIMSTTAMVACNISDALRAADPSFDAGTFHLLAQHKETR